MTVSALCSQHFWLRPQQNFPSRVGSLEALGDGCPHHGVAGFGRSSFKRPCGRPPWERKIQFWNHCTHTHTTPRVIGSKWSVEDLSRMWLFHFDAVCGKCPDAARSHHQRADKTLATEPLRGWPPCRGGEAQYLSGFKPDGEAKSRPRVTVCRWPRGPHRVWEGTPRARHFWVNASRVIPPMTIANVKNPSIYIFF